MGDDLCDNDQDHEHLIVSDDEALDFIIYQEMSKNSGGRTPPSGHGCFFVFLLPALFTTGLYLMMI